jgi:hypothetical protein
LAQCYLPRTSDQLKIEAEKSAGAQNTRENGNKKPGNIHEKRAEKKPSKGWSGRRTSAATYRCFQPVKKSSRSAENKSEINQQKIPKAGCSKLCKDSPNQCIKGGQNSPIWVSSSKDYHQKPAPNLHRLGTIFYCEF